MRSVEEDLERRLENWALWYWGGGVGSRGVASIYGFGARPRRYGDTPVPVINGEAIDTDNAVHRLNVDLQAVLRARYLRVAPAGYTMRTLSEIQVAAALYVSYATYLRRQRVAKAALVDQLRALRRAVAKGGP